MYCCNTQFIIGYVQMIANFMFKNFFKFIYNYYLILNFIRDVSDIFML